jgi:formate-dependent nitrite reductase membrane component NrfD
MMHHEWNWMIVVYLFVGGLGAGSLALSGTAHLLRRHRYSGIARAGALAAPVLVAFGSGLLVFDLGRPLRFWRLFTTMNPVSPMSIGSWLLALFMLVSGAYALLHIPPKWLQAAAARFGKSLGASLEALARWNDTDPERCPAGIARLRSILAAAGIPLGLGVGIYTGVLLGAIPARPFWNTPMVAQLFLFSALSTATAMLLLITPMLWHGSAEHRAEQRRILVRADLVFIFLELFIIIPFLVHAELSTLSAREALWMILGGPYTTIFWIGVVACGILVPMVLELADTLGAGRILPRPVLSMMHYAAPVMILVGGYLLRWVFVHAGQETQFL